ncbi:MAG: YkgJ family cysteine cluster protein [Cyanobacteriota bacterium]
MINHWFFREKILFSCNKCGECCHEMDVPLSHVDIIKLLKNNIEAKDFIDLIISSENEPYSVFIYGEYVSLYLRNKDDDNACIFLENNVCSVYETRPNSCRTWPFSRKKSKLLIDDYAGKVVEGFCDKKRVKNHKEIDLLIDEGIEEVSEYQNLINKWNNEFSNKKEEKTLDDFIKYIS